LIRIEDALIEGKSAALENIAFHDHLTGLPNRLSLMDRIGQAIVYSDRSSKSFAVCFMDLDGFKLINDNYGHDIGDLVLKEVATRLKDCMRASDTVARIGGDEFVLLLVDHEDGDTFEVFLDRLKKSVAEPIRLRSGNLLKVGISIGVTTYPADSCSPDDLLKHADEAMYRAKKSKDNWFQIYKS
jgi:diguanylate cyclase (GGDEF)-like protein